MGFTIQKRIVGDVTIIICEGHITLGAATSQLRNTLRETLQGGSKKILINLQKVTYLDSTGIGELVGAYTSATGAGASIKLLHLPAKIYDLLRITKLVTIFEIFDDETAAVKSF